MVWGPPLSNGEPSLLPLQPGELRWSYPPPDATFLLRFLEEARAQASPGAPGAAPPEGAFGRPGTPSPAPPPPSPGAAAALAEAVTSSGALDPDAVPALVDAACGLTRPEAVDLVAGMRENRLATLACTAPALVRALLTQCAPGAPEEPDEEAELCGAALLRSLALQSQLDVAHLSLGRAAVELGLWAGELALEGAVWALQGLQHAEGMHPQPRLARLVCQLLKAMLPGMPAVLLLPELESFCIAHSSQQDAAELFQLSRLYRGGEDRGG